MKIKKHIIMKTFTFLLFSIFALSVNAQLPGAGGEEVKTDFSDEALVKYIRVVEEAAKLQQKAQAEAVAIIKEKGLDLQRFNQIFAVEQGKSDAPVSEEEMAAFEEASRAIMEKNEAVQEKLLEIVRDNGLTAKKYRQILLAYENSVDFKARVDAMILERKKE